MTDYNEEIKGELSGYDYDFNEAQRDAIEGATQALDEQVAKDAHLSPEQEAKLTATELKEIYKIPEVDKGDGRHIWAKSEDDSDILTSEEFRLKYGLAKN